nr:MAG TPA: hypothetical protein [Caudoviricetes sp.]
MMTGGCKQAAARSPTSPAKEKAPPHPPKENIYISLRGGR